MIRRIHQHFACRGCDSPRFLEDVDIVPMVLPRTFVPAAVVAVLVAAVAVVLAVDVAVAVAARVVLLAAMDCRRAKAAVAVVAAMEM
jgi:DNA recombination-dependent growth factor C